ncbi:phage tail assembly chaperone [Paracoccus sp. (in: a-proteobacteria)]|uniref:phage tail assembly chaperone n=1 Tax=Paracoccus sp. TaxID=267 RepID=UPI002AFF4CFC|nr:phage tail assembly chaperone [Paracoccus sp. (in: a-proteobacteria)]
MTGGLDWPGLLRLGLGPVRMGGLGLRPDEFWALTPAELALMLRIAAGRGGAMTRARLTELAARYPDRPLEQHNEKGGPS